MLWELRGSQTPHQSVLSKETILFQKVKIQIHDSKLKKNNKLIESRIELFILIKSIYKYKGEAPLLSRIDRMHENEN